MATTTKLKKKLTKFEEQFDKVTANIKKVLDDKAVDALITLGVGYLGYDAMKNTKYPLKGAIMAMTSYKLARTEGTVSQVAGVIGLATIGAVWSLRDVVPTTPGEGETFWERVAQQECPENYILEWDILHGWHCIPIPIGPPG